MAPQRFGISIWAGRGLALSLFLLCAAVAAAQLTTGTISGTVTDQSGGSAPGVSITITNTETGISRTTTSGPTGRYNAPSLPLGNYEVRATLPGFQTSVRSGIQLTVGRNAVVNHILQVGEVTQAVTVTGEAALVETTTATVSNLVTEEQVLDLPLNNRDLVALTYLQPGVLKVPQSDRQGVFSGMGNKLSVAGGRQTHNLYLSDGMASTDLSGNIAGATGGSTGVETIQEFQVITNNYSAEYQSAAGAIISMVTKSGTNALHGSLFEFLRNDNLDAANFFDNSFGTPKPEFRRNQFGAAVGGPIVRDRTFFFGSFEALREARPRTDSVRMPTIDARNGILPGEDPIEVDPAVVPYLALYPIPGQGNSVVRDFGDGTLLLAGTTNEDTTENYISSKIDHQFTNEKIGFVTGTWNYVRSDRSRFGLLGDISGDSENSGSEALKGERDSVSASLTSIFSPTALNVFKFGFTKTNPQGEIPIVDRDFGDLVFNDTPRGLMGQINSPGEVDSIGWRVNGSSYRQEQFTFADDFSLTRGNHSLKFGALFDRFIMDQNNQGSGVNGIWEWRSWPDFLTARPRRLTVELPGELINLDEYPVEPGWEFSGPFGRRHNHNAKQSSFGVYFQDNWQVRPSFALNLGLRYSFTTIPREVNGASGALRDFNDPRVTIGPVFGNNPTMKSFSPRFGFAWAPGDQRTSVRGGFGIFYDHPRYYHIRTSFAITPPFILATRVDADSRGNVRRVPGVPPGTRLEFPHARFTQTDFLTANPRPDIRPQQFMQELAYITRWSLNVQRELGTSWLVSAGYTGSRGVHLWIMERGELSRWRNCPTRVACGPDTQVSQFPVNPEPGQFKFFDPGLGLINSNFGVFRPQIPAATMDHHGLTLSATQRLTRGLQWQISYQFSKTIDMGSGITSGGDNLPQGQRGVYLYDLHRKRSLSSHDIRNNFVSNWSWDVPSGNMDGVAGAVLGGWQVNGILTLIDGHPLTVIDNSSAQDDAIGQNDLLTPNAIPNANLNPVTGNVNQWFDPSQFIPGACVGDRFCRPGDPDYQPGFFGNVGRNTFTSAGLAQFDFSVFKNFTTSETTSVQFRAEFFNLFNRPNFGEPVEAVIDSDDQVNAEAGQISETLGAARQIQFGLKFIF